MEPFATPVRELMASPVKTIEDTMSLAEAEREMSAFGISALAVVDRAGALVGVLSRRDLLRVGRLRATNGRRLRALNLPTLPVREVMHATVEVVAPTTPISEAARRMLRQHLHRLYVSEDRRPAGVVGTKEMMRAVIAARVSLPISDFMHPAVVSVRADDPLVLAVDRMAATHITGLVVLDGDWPVGVFTQVDALAARDASAEARVDEWMDPRVICLPMAMPAFRAAEQAVATRARRVLVTDAKGIRGIVTGMDFTRLVKG